MKPDSLPNLEPNKLNELNNQKYWVFGLITFTLVLVAFGSYILFDFYSEKILPRTTINGISVGGLTIEQATTKIATTAAPPENQELKIFVDDISVSSDSASLGTAYRFDETARIAFVQGKKGQLVVRFFEIISAFFNPNQFQSHLQYDKEKLGDLITNLKILVDIIGEEPSATLGISGNADSIKINPGMPGRMLEAENTATMAQELLSEGRFEVRAVVASTSTQLSGDEQARALERSKKLVSKSLDLILDIDEFVRLKLTDKELISFLDFPKEKAYKTSEIEEAVDSWAESVNREPQDAILEYDEENLKVKKFVPHKLGLELNTDKITKDLVIKLNELENSQSVEKQELIAESKITEPEKTLEKTNNIGIKERIGYGESEYDHSIPNRVHNVAITTERVSNILVAPGEEFSFNKTLGEVSSRTGYRSAYIIRNGRTELGDGGGVCQVSTTLFRSVLNAGLDVTLRLPHSYRVSYYELDSKPGADATVYSGNVDFRFKNDTDHYILIHGQADSKNLSMYYEIYGTSDGRSAEIVDHKVWDARSAPAPQYFDDPSLPAGTLKQIDFATGGIKASFKNVIKDKDGKIIREDEYFSNYRPWSAKYLRGTGV